VRITREALVSRNRIWILVLAVRITREALVSRNRIWILVMSSCRARVK